MRIATAFRSDTTGFSHGGCSMVSVIRVAGAVVFSLVAASVSMSASADTLAKIRKSGEFVLGHRESSVPFSSTTPDGKAQGYSVDICLRIFDQVKADLKRTDLQVKYVSLKPAERIPAIKDGRVDVECGSTTNTVARQKDAAFSYTTFVAGARLLAKTNANLSGLESLKGKSVAVSEKTTTERVISQTNSERNLGIKIVPTKDNIDAFKKMEAGEADAVVGDDAVLLGLASKSANPAQFSFVGKFLSVEPYGVMLRRDDPAFAAVVDKAILQLFASGEINKIYAKWFESGTFKLPMNQYMKENVRLPNKYGVQ
jgi:glutamate/aspartate transport system substrate-binding protein